MVSRQTLSPVDVEMHDKRYQTTCACRPMLARVSQDAAVSGTVLLEKCPLDSLSTSHDSKTHCSILHQIRAFHHLEAVKNGVESVSFLQYRRITTLVFSNQHIATRI